MLDLQPGPGTRGGDAGMSTWRATRDAADRLLDRLSTVHGLHLMERGQAPRRCPDCGSRVEGRQRPHAPSHRVRDVVAEELQGLGGAIPRLLDRIEDLEAELQRHRWQASTLAELAGRYREALLQHGGENGAEACGAIDADVREDRRAG